MVQTLTKKMRSMINRMENLARVMENKGTHSLNKCNPEISLIYRNVRTCHFFISSTAIRRSCMQLLKVF